VGEVSVGQGQRDRGTKVQRDKGTEGMGISH
jgi:hypothetical protein